MRCLIGGMWNEEDSSGELSVLIFQKLRKRDVLI
jgi:hypothetical protein